MKAPKAQGGNPKARLKKGEKTGTKQMATVSVTSSFKPKQRNVAAIVDGLMGQEKQAALSKKQTTQAGQPKQRIGKMEEDCPSRPR